MAGKEVFLKNGFEEIATRNRFGLVINRLKPGPEPRFRDLTGRRRRRPGLQVVYADQCPMLGKSADDLAVMAAEHGLDLEITRLRTAREAQDAPSYYGVYSLLWNGQVLSDHYVSRGRFRNLLRQVILKQPSPSEWRTRRRPRPAA